MRSCLTTLLDFFNYVYNGDFGSVDISYFDFQKAFDKVPHVRLLTKLKAHGVTGNIHKWIEDWLSERKQRLVIKGISSGWRRVKICSRPCSLFFFMSMTSMTVSLVKYLSLQMIRKLPVKLLQRLTKNFF